MQRKIPKAIKVIGNMKLEMSYWQVDSIPMRLVEDKTKAAQDDSANEPNRSALIPATSPTLSPTLSAMVAGFFGLSYGKPFYTLPTKSAPTSAALVYIPPPTRPNKATKDPPSP